MESRLIHRIIEEIARGRRWTFEEDVLKMPGVESNPLVVEFAEKLLAWQKGR